MPTSRCLIEQARWLIPIPIVGGLRLYHLQSYPPVHIAINNSVLAIERIFAFKRKRVNRFAFAVFRNQANVGFNERE